MKPKHEIPWRRHLEVRKKNQRSARAAEIDAMHREHHWKKLEERISEHERRAQEAKERAPWWGLPAWSR